MKHLFLQSHNTCMLPSICERDMFTLLIFTVHMLRKFSKNTWNLHCHSRNVRNVCGFVLTTHIWRCVDPKQTSSWNTAQEDTGLCFTILNVYILIQKYSEKTLVTQKIQRQNLKHKIINIGNNTVIPFISTRPDLLMWSLQKLSRMQYEHYISYQFIDQCDLIQIKTELVFSLSILLLSNLTS